MSSRARSTTLLSVKQPASFKKIHQKAVISKSLIIRLKIPKLVDGNEIISEPSCVDLKKKSLVIKLKVPKRIADDVTPPKHDVTPPKPIIPKSLLEKSAPAPALTGNKNRDYIRQNFAKSLGKAAEELGHGSNKVGDLVVSMENCLYESWGFCNGLKKQKYLSVLFNLRDDKNPDFRKKVLQGVVAPEEISTLTPKEMASEARKLEDQKILEAKKEQEIKVSDDDYVMQKD